MTQQLGAGRASSPGAEKKGDLVSTKTEEQIETLKQQLVEPNLTDKEIERIERKITFLQSLDQ